MERQCDGAVFIKSSAAFGLGDHFITGVKMEIRYKNTFSDLIKFNLYHHPRILSLQAITIFFLVVFLWETYRYWQKTDSPILALIISWLIVSIFWAFLVGIMMFVGIMLTNLPKLNKSFLTEHTLIVSDSGLVDETSFNRTEQKWSGVIKVSQNRHYIFIYTAQHAAHVVPKRAFVDVGRAESFYNDVCNWWRAANQS